MSTYLVGFVVSKFAEIHDNSGKGKKIEVVGEPTAINAGYGEFALEDTKIMIDYFSVYYQVDYPLEKYSNILDQF